MTPGLQVISESREAETDRSIWKIMILGILGIVASVASISGFNRLLIAGNYIYLWPTLIIFSVFLIISILQLFLIKSLYKLGIIVFLESAIPLLLFWDKIYPQPSAILVSGAALAFVFLFFAARRSRKILENNIKIRFFETTRTFLPKIVTGFLIFFSVILYLNYFEWGNFTQDIGRSAFSGVLAGSEPIVSMIVPGVSFQSTVRDFLKGLATNELNKTSISIPDVSSSSPETYFRFLPEKDQENFINQATDQLQNAMAAKFGKIDPNEKFSDFAYDVISKYSSDISSSSPWILPAIVILLFFFIIKGISMLLYWLISFIAFIFFKMLIVMGFTYFNLETRSREFTLLP